MWDSTLRRPWGEEEQIVSDVPAPPSFFQSELSDIQPLWKPAAPARAKILELWPGLPPPVADEAPPPPAPLPTAGNPSPQAIKLLRELAAAARSFSASAVAPLATPPAALPLSAPLQPPAPTAPTPPFVLWPLLASLEQSAKPLPQPTSASVAAAQPSPAAAPDQFTPFPTLETLLRRDAAANPPPQATAPPAPASALSPPAELSAPGRLMPQTAPDRPSSPAVGSAAWFAQIPPPLRGVALSGLQCLQREVLEASASAGQPVPATPPLPTALARFAQFRPNDFADRARLAEKFGVLVAPNANRRLAAVVGEQVFSQLAATTDDATKVFDVTSSPLIEGFSGCLAIAIPSFGLWQAIQNHDKTDAALAGVLIAANVVDLAVTLSGVAAPVANYVRGLVFLVKTATSATRLYRVVVRSATRGAAPSN